MQGLNLVKIIFLFFLKGILIGGILFILLFNYSLYYNPEFVEVSSNESSLPAQEKAIYNNDVYKQLIHLKKELRNGAGQDMQSIYPEGLIFINALYGITWTEVISGLPKEHPIYKEGIKEATWAIDALNTKEAKGIFHRNLTLIYGAFYRGWTNYLLGKKLIVQDENDRDPEDLRLFLKNCEDISLALKKEESPYLESYFSQKWPADGIVASASLALHQKVTNSSKYEVQLSEWMTKVKSTLDKKTGLIPHSVETDDDEIMEGARGSSQSLILNFIKEIEPSFAEEQFSKYKEHFLDWRMGMPGIREYPKGVPGNGDIDSGPVILEIGGAASIVGQRTMGVYGDWYHYNALRNCIETFGVGYSSKSSKRYLFGQLPMADAFIAWSNSIEQAPVKVKKRGFWRLKTQFLSFVLILLFGYLLFKTRRGNK